MLLHCLIACVPLLLAPDATAPNAEPAKAGADADLDLATVRAMVVNLREIVLSSRKRIEHLEAENAELRKSIQELQAQRTQSPRTPSPPAHAPTSTPSAESAASVPPAGCTSEYSADSDTTRLFTAVQGLSGLLRIEFSANYNGRARNARGQVESLSVIVVYKNGSDMLGIEFADQHMILKTALYAPGRSIFQLPVADFLALARSPSAKLIFDQNEIPLTADDMKRLADYAAWAFE